jgi:phosphatidylserine/phosphatidylglycerophosphate/cardiolipin synthase-like enzyme
MINKIGLTGTGWWLLTIFMLGGCASTMPSSDYMDQVGESGTGATLNTTAGLPEKIILRNASGRALTFNDGVMLTDNNQAFLAKLNMVRSARESIDMAYYIYSDDYTSSALSHELIEAARRGVRVRMLVDYHSSYKDLDMFSMLEKYANSGAGSLRVRFYNRPTKNIVKDAVYLTLGCGEATGADRTDCSTAKYNQIERLFANETIDGRPVGRRNISNLNSGGSGLFLSGLYGKYPPLMVLAVNQGQHIDLDRLKASGSALQVAPGDALQLGQAYWLAETGGPWQRLVNKLKLAFALQMYSEEINPILNEVKVYAPVSRLLSDTGARRDWDYLTDFLHHKLLLIDQRQVMLGGRNIEDSYHMVPNRLTDKYIFMDTDVYLNLGERHADLSGSFERLWNFEEMVATLGDVRQHAPNDTLVATRAAKTVCERLEGGDPETYAACQQQAFMQQRAIPLDQRLDEQYRHMQSNRDVYAQRYRGGGSPAPLFPIDARARIYYLENLPFDSSVANTRRVRHYGSENGKEREYGKHIHEIWIAALSHVCEVATAAQPQQVILHNAYFFLPSNLLRQLGAMTDGSMDCRHVTVKVLTNSIDTTDLNVVNIAARQSIKAFVDYRRQVGTNERAARFQYYEYKPQSVRSDGRPDRSLHTKVMVFGPDIYVGSANADIRSYMMDSNNGFYISAAPQFVATYSGWLQSLMNDSRRTRDTTDYFATADRQQMLAEDLQVLRAIMQRYDVQRWIDNPVQLRLLETYYIGLLNTIYRLSLQSLQPGRAGREPAKDFNAYFKLI